MRSRSSASELLREYLRLQLHNVPRYKLQSTTDDFIDELRRLFKQHFNSTKSYTPLERSQAVNSLEAALKNIEKQLTDIIGEELQDLLTKI